MRKLILLFCCCFSLVTFSQKSVQDSIVRTVLLGVHYSPVIPVGQLAKDYGFMQGVGVVANFKNKHNWVYGFEGNLFFINKLKNDSLLNALKDNEGNITEVGGGVGTAVLGVRGFNVNAHIGKIFPAWGPNPNCGIYVSLGVGYILNKIHIETNEDVIPMIEKHNRRNYDHQTVGMNVAQFIGYSFMGNRGLASFYAGFYFNEAFTKNSRSYFYDTGEASSKKLRLDIRLGLRAGWYIPIYKRQAKSYYFN